ncbi:MAG: extracellular solute-binding protein [Streptosporangiaceae bacterium]|nr:extracellular solute-binding protein [Streptosporangiaceae bacterium]MBV9853306.1 extracellular solute-binding protein [Streptosporangiaceae bacterium]
MSRQLHRRAGCRAIAGSAAAALLAAAVACSSSGNSAAAPNSGGHVTISVDCAPPASSPQQHKEWNEDVALFEKANPNITVDSIYTSPCEVPATFTAMLRAGTEPSVFYTYFTDRNQVLDAGQAADITPYVNTRTVPMLHDIVPSAMAAVTAGSTIYGLPTSNYTQGLIINRKLFLQAGLNPDSPPTTWARVEADAKAITRLGHGIYGYGDYSAGNNGGWHFSSELDAMGGHMINSAGTSASFDTPQAAQILQALHTMRFVDHSMSPTQQLQWGALQKQMAAGKLGMYIAAPDDIYNVIVPQDGGNIGDYGMGPLPSATGTPAGSLSGGNDYMFAKRDTPAQIEAGIKWVVFESLTPGQGVYFNFARQKADGFPVGFPEPQLFDGATQATYTRLMDASATVNPSYYSAFSNARETPMGEPADAQAVYKTLDPVMLSVLTDPNANISQLLSAASSQVNQILANSGG